MSRSPPNQKGTLAKHGLSESGKCIGNLQPCEWRCVLACVFRRGARLCVSACGRLDVTNAQAHFIGRWGVTVWLAKARLIMRVPCEMGKPLACLRGRLTARGRAVGCSLGYYKRIYNNVRDLFRSGTLGCKRGPIYCLRHSLHPYACSNWKFARPLFLATMIFCTPIQKQKVGNRCTTVKRTDATKRILKNWFNESPSTSLQREHGGISTK